MLTTALITGGAIFALLILSGFFSGSETALTAASRARMHHLELEEGSKPAAKVNRLIAARERLISAILIGNNLVNILASALATSLLLTLTGGAGVVWATLLMTALIVIFSEVLPKTYAITHPDRSALAAAPILVPIVKALSPLAAAVEFVTRQILRRFEGGTEAGDALVSAREELRGQIALHHKAGAVVKHDLDMLAGILDLRDLEVSEVMVHRTGMTTVDIGEAPEKIVEDALASGHTRIPVWEEEPDNIIGILHAKELLRALSRTRGDAARIDIRSLVATAWFVPESTRLTDQLNAFMRRRAHIAIVVDEYGEVMGLVTLEDVLEVIVGDISDEHDVVVEGVRRHANGSVTVDGLVAVRDLNRAMGWRLPDEEATTVAGLVIHEAQTIPDVGQVFTYHGYRFEILRRHRNRIAALRVTPVDQPERREHAA